MVAIAASETTPRVGSISQRTRAVGGTATSGGKRSMRIPSTTMRPSRSKALAVCVSWHGAPRTSVPRAPGAARRRYVPRPSCQRNGRPPPQSPATRQRRVEKDGVVFGHREVVHEAEALTSMTRRLDDLSRTVDAVERQMGARELAEGEELARAGVDLPVRGEGRVDAPEIDRADGLEA